MKITKEQRFSQKKIESFQFLYQPKLNLSQPFQYGIELEFSDANIDIVKEKIKKFYHTYDLVYGQDWYVDIDESVTDYLYGGELKSPISYNEENDWTELQKVCEIVKSLDGTVNEKCSVHVHVDFNRLDYSILEWERFLKLWGAYEDVLLEFSRVGQEKLRDYSNEYAIPIHNYLVKAELYHISVLKLMSGLEKSFCLNMKSLYYALKGESCALPTIEFRSCNGTLEPVLIQNIVRTFAHLLALAKVHHPELDHLIMKRLLEEDPDVNEKMLELSELLFTDEFEQMSFLKQCMMKEKKYCLKK